MPRPFFPCSGFPPRGNDGGVRGRVIGGVLCFSLGSRLRGNDGKGGEGSRVAWLVGMPRSMALLASFLHHLTFRKGGGGGGVIVWDDVQFRWNFLRVLSFCLAVCLAPRWWHH